MRLTSRPTILVWLLLLPLAVACGGGGNGGSGHDDSSSSPPVVNPPPAPQATIPKDIIALHDQDLAAAVPSCQSADCHPDQMDRYAAHRTAGGQQVENFHYFKVESLPGWFGGTDPANLEDRQCTVCHKRVRLLTGTGGDGPDLHLRRTVDVALCAMCHTSSGPATPLYQK